MADLYEQDFYTWALTQADFLRTRSGNRLDWDRLAEELQSLGASEERELGSRLEVLISHLLKWIYQPERRSRSWENTIRAQRQSLAKHLRRNPGLKSIEAAEFLDAYETARLAASSETDLDVAVFPPTPPFSLEQARDPAWWPPG